MPNKKWVNSLFKRTCSEHNVVKHQFFFLGGGGGGGGGGYFKHHRQCNPHHEIHLSFLLIKIYFCDTQKKVLSLDTIIIASFQ